MKSLIIAGLVAIALAGCGGGTTEADEDVKSSEYQSLLALQSTVKSGTVGDYQDKILEAQIEIDQIDDPAKKVMYEGILSLHKMAYDLARCPDVDDFCTVNAIGDIKNSTSLDIGVPKDEDPDRVLGLVWAETSELTASLESAGWD